MDWRRQTEEDQNETILQVWMTNFGKQIFLFGEILNTTYDKVAEEEQWWIILLSSSLDFIQFQISEID